MDIPNKMACIVYGVQWHYMKAQFDFIVQRDKHSYAFQRIYLVHLSLSL